MCGFKNSVAKLDRIQVVLLNQVQSLVQHLLLEILQLTFLHLAFGLDGKCLEPHELLLNPLESVLSPPPRDSFLHLLRAVFSVVLHEQLQTLQVIIVQLI